ncbi:MAG: small multi-drug export protein [Acutalibacteraceae bacterium]|nr:small multi-drug export protein [Acutalibacteraceae bacterium]
MTEELVHSFVDFFRSKIPDELLIFIISMLPILELRGGLIAAALLDVNLFFAFPICVIGNMLPIPFVLLFIRKIFELLKKTRLFSKLITKLDTKAKEKANSKTMLKYKAWGLFLFVAIPLPGTGAWTGALVADVMDTRIKTAFPLITAGVISAGLIMAFISYGIPAIINML